MRVIIRLVLIVLLLLLAIVITYTHIRTGEAPARNRNVRIKDESSFLITKYIDVPDSIGDSIFLLIQDGDTIIVDTLRNGKRIYFSSSGIGNVKDDRDGKYKQGAPTANDSIVPRISPPGGGYSPKEVFVIPWGHGTDSLPVNEPIYADPNLSKDSIIIFERQGPDITYVDRNDNFFFGSTVFNYIKGFDRNGKENVCLSANGPDSSFKVTSLANFYVDTLSRIFIESMTKYAFGPNFVAIVNRQGSLLGKIDAKDCGISMPLAQMKRNSGDVLTFTNYPVMDYYTYRSNKLLKGGLDGWLANNHYYYSAMIIRDFEGQRKMMFTIYGDPTLPKYANVRQTYKAAFELTDDMCQLLGVGDDGRIYVVIPHYWRDSKSHDSFLRRIVLIYDKNFTLIEQFTIPVIISKNYHSYALNMIYRSNGSISEFRAGLFFRPCDGSIFEYRLLDDGLHVARWSRND